MRAKARGVLSPRAGTGALSVFVYAEAPERHQFLKVVQSWDTGMTAALTSDFSVCTTWGFEWEQCKWYLLDVYRERLDFPDLKRAVIRLQRRWQADAVLIEDAGSGKSLWQEFRTSGPLRPIMIRPVSSKEDRFNGCLAEVEAGHLLLPVDAPWLAGVPVGIKGVPQWAV